MNISTLGYLAVICSEGIGVRCNARHGMIHTTFEYLDPPSFAMVICVPQTNKSGGGGGGELSLSIPNSFDTRVR